MVYLSDFGEKATRRQGVTIEPLQVRACGRLYRVVTSRMEDLGIALLSLR